MDKIHTDSRLCLAAFLNATIQKDYEAVYNCWQLTFKENHSLESIPDYEPKSIFGADLKSYKIIEETEYTMAVRDFKVEVELTDGRELLLAAKLIKEHGPYKPCAREGRKRGRGIKHFYKEGAKINNCNLMPEEEEFIKLARQLPFVTGYKVHLSLSHPTVDICDNMLGVYPKTFVFSGWHPNCYCYTTSEMLSRKAFKGYLKTGYVNPTH